MLSSQLLTEGLGDGVSTTVKLTTLAHGGGCGCKLAPSVLQELLSNAPLARPFSELLVGNETSDDSAVWQINETTCIVATTDFFMPIVDDPVDFGRIAATNAISDVYAMGAKPIMALAILGMPLGKLSLTMVRDILKGGASICAQAGIPVAGGHSIDSPEPIYGLVVIGICHPGQIKRNSSARAGDALILTKALGVGFYSAALKRSQLDDNGYAELIASTTQLNAIGTKLGGNDSVHAMTDVTGFGVLGHAIEMATGSKVQITISMSELPLLPQAKQLSKRGFVTGASHRNWASAANKAELFSDIAEWQKNVLTDPQTSGGLLISCPAQQASALVSQIQSAGYASARVIGTVSAGGGGARVVP
ncbi:MAG: selenide,water dikinase SelD [Proteobacteria bacterium SG_bin9]|nr:MAG: selenide,water dikinase SelD [Proteobacteria bacterium SG_bin9]